MADIFSNLRRLGAFKGRERRGRFWPYAGFVFAMIMVVSGIGMSVAIGAAFSPADSSIEGSPQPSAFASIDKQMFLGNALIMAASVSLLAAAVSRRLHDSGLRAYWGLLPIPFLVIALVILPKVFASLLEGGDMRLFSVLFVNNGLYIASIITLIVLLCRPTKDGPNRYGDEPA